MAEGSARLGVGQIELAGWRYLLGALRTRFTTGSLTAGAAFAAAAAALPGGVEGGLDVDLRAGHAQLAVRSPDAGGVTERDVQLAERLSALAREHALVAHPEQVQVLELALDSPDPQAVGPFWAAVLDGDQQDEDVVDPAGELPLLWFQRSGSTAADRQRFHLDVTVSPEVAARRIAAAVAAGGRVVDDGRAPAFVVLADREGNRVCVCTELGRD